MTRQHAHPEPEREIRNLLDRWIEGARKGDLDGIMACYTPEVRAFDAIAALQFEGAEAYRKHWETCLSHVPGEMIVEVHDLQVSAHGDVAFGHYLSRCGFTDDDGNAQTGWMRGTIGCIRTANGWRITHEHYSLPFDPVTHKILDDLQPGEAAADQGNLSYCQGAQGTPASSDCF